MSLPNIHRVLGEVKKKVMRLHVRCWPTCQRALTSKENKHPMVNCHYFDVYVELYVNLVSGMDSYRIYSRTGVHITYYLKCRHQKNLRCLSTSVKLSTLSNIVRAFFYPPCCHGCQQIQVYVAGCYDIPSNSSPYFSV